MRNIIKWLCALICVICMIITLSSCRTLTDQENEWFEREFKDQYEEPYIPEVR